MESGTLALYTRSPPLPFLKLKRSGVSQQFTVTAPSSACGRMPMSASAPWYL